MPISFICPHCGADNTVADECAGQNGPCTQCGKAIEIPGAAKPDDVPPRRRPSRATLLMNLTMVGGVVLVLATLFFAKVVVPRGREENCTSNLKCIALAMHNYHAIYRCFPPAYTSDKDGKPMHSWRVLLLPFYCDRPLFNKFNLNEPWDGPNNIRLAKQGYRVYHCPGDTSGQNGAETSYVMVVGPGAISDGPTATTLTEITDGALQTLMIVEVANSGILWTEPRDLDAKELGLGINSPGGAGIRSRHSKKANVAFCDGHVKALGNDTPPQTLIDLSTIAGGEDVSKFQH